MEKLNKSLEELKYVELTNDQAKKIIGGSINEDSYLGRTFQDRT